MPGSMLLVGLLVVVGIAIVLIVIEQKKPSHSEQLIRDLHEKQKNNKRFRMQMKSMSALGDMVPFTDDLNGGRWKDGRQFILVADYEAETVEAKFVDEMTDEERNHYSQQRGVELDPTTHKQSRGSSHQRRSRNGGYMDMDGDGIDDRVTGGPFTSSDSSSSYSGSSSDD